MRTLRKIAGFIGSSSYDRFPRSVDDAVKRAFIDTLGVCLAGCQDEPSVVITNYIRSNPGSPRASVIGSGLKTTAADAALANGTILHALDFDDTGAFTQGHPSAPIFSAILALAQENGNSGQEIIEAYVIGVEVLSRLARSMPMMHLKGWHPTAVLGAIAAAAASAKLLKLDEEKTVSALSLAGSQACGLVKNFGTMAKPFHVGKASSNGVLAAELAKHGFKASEDLFDGNLSFPKAFGFFEEEKLDQMMNSLGEPLAIVSPGINIKRYPACSLTHRAIDAMLYLCSTHDIQPELVESVDCRVPPRAIEVLFHNKPLAGLEGKFSMQFVLACALKFRAVTISHFTDSLVNDRGMRALQAKVVFGVHSDWKEGDDARADVVTVTLKNGDIFSHGVEIPAGNVKSPLTQEQVIEKYRNCTGVVLNEEQINETLDLLLNLEYLDSISQLMSIVG